MLRSNIRLGDDREDVAYSGAKLDDARKVSIMDITICIRYYVGVYLVQYVDQGVHQTLLLSIMSVGRAQVQLPTAWGEPGEEQDHNN